MWRLQLAIDFFMILWFSRNISAIDSTNNTAFATNNSTSNTALLSNREARLLFTNVNETGISNMFTNNSGSSLNSTDSGYEQEQLHIPKYFVDVGSLSNTNVSRKDSDTMQDDDYNAMPASHWFDPPRARPRTRMPLLMPRRSQREEQERQMFSGPPWMLNSAAGNGNNFPPFPPPNMGMMPGLLPRPPMFGGGMNVPGGEALFRPRVDPSYRGLSSYVNYAPMQPVVRSSFANEPSRVGARFQAASANNQPPAAAPNLFGASLPNNPQTGFTSSVVNVAAAPPPPPKALQTSNWTPAAPNVGVTTQDSEKSRQTNNALFARQQQQGSPTSPEQPPLQQSTSWEPGPAIVSVPPLFTQITSPATSAVSAGAGGETVSVTQNQPVQPSLAAGSEQERQYGPVNNININNADASALISPEAVPVTLPTMPAITANRQTPVLTRFATPATTTVSPPMLRSMSVQVIADPTPPQQQQAVVDGPTITVSGSNSETPNSIEISGPGNFKTRLSGLSINSNGVVRFGDPIAQPATSTTLHSNNEFVQAMQQVAQQQQVARQGQASLTPPATSARRPDAAGSNEAMAQSGSVANANPSSNFPITLDSAGNTVSSSASSSASSGGGTSNANANSNSNANSVANGGGFTLGNLLPNQPFNPSTSSSSISSSASSSSSGNGGGFGQGPLSPQQTPPMTVVGIPGGNGGGSYVGTNNNNNGGGTIEVNGGGPNNGFVLPPISVQTGGGGGYGGGGFGNQITPTVGGAIVTPGPPPEFNPFRMTRVGNLDANCVDRGIQVNIAFNGTFTGIIYSLGYESQPNCVYAISPPSNPSPQQQANGVDRQFRFVVPLDACGSLSVPNGFPASGSPPQQNGGSTTSLVSNRIYVQYDPLIQEEWDESFTLECTYAPRYEKAVNVPVPLTVFVGNGRTIAAQTEPPRCTMLLLGGRGLEFPPLNGPVQIGDTLTLVVRMSSNSASQHYDMVLRNCFATDGANRRIELTDGVGCTRRPKLIGDFAVGPPQSFYGGGTPFNGGPSGSGGDRILYTFMKVFRFTGSRALYLQCDVLMCVDSCAADARCLQADDPDVAANRSHNTQSFDDEDGTRLLRSITHDNRSMLKKSPKTTFAQKLKFNLLDVKTLTATAATPVEQHSLISSIEVLDPDQSRYAVHALAAGKTQRSNSSKSTAVSRRDREFENLFPADKPTAAALLRARAGDLSSLDKLSVPQHSTKVTNDRDSLSRYLILGPAAKANDSPTVFTRDDTLRKLDVAYNGTITDENIAADIAARGHAWRLNYNDLDNTQVCVARATVGFILFGALILLGCTTVSVVLCCLAVRQRRATLKSCCYYGGNTESAKKFRSNASITSTSSGGSTFSLQQANVHADAAKRSKSSGGGRYSWATQPLSMLTSSHL